MQILKATRADKAVLLPMMMQFNREESIALSIDVMERTLELSHSHPEYIQTFLVYEGESTIGYIHVCYTFSFEYLGLEASIDEIFILKDYRGQGLARSLMREIENEVASKGVVVIRADVS